MSMEPEARAAARAQLREHGLSHGAHKDPAELEREIDATRAELRLTLDALEQRLSTDHLLEMTVGRVREHGGEFAAHLGHSVKAHPMPLLLTSIGIAWMMLNDRREGRGDHGTRPVDESDSRWAPSADRVRAGVSSVRETVGHARERMEHSQEAVAHAAQSLRASGGRVAAAARHGISRARVQTDRMLEERPLMLGALGVAAGAIIGAVLPASRAEQRLIGDARERALQRAQQASSEGYRALRARARTMAEEAKQHLSATDDDGSMKREEPASPPSETTTPPF